MKQIYLLLIAIICLPGFLMANNYSGEKFIVEGIRYEITGTNTVQVISGGEYSGEVTIPSHITLQGRDYTVTAIGDEAFRNCEALTGIVLPNTITSIGEKAFRACSEISNMEIPSSVRSIGASAFENCIDLESINIPFLVTSVEQSVFSGCMSLKNIDIPASVTSIGNSAFAHCVELTSVDIPTSVKSIGNYAFSDCIRLTSMYIPASVTSIGRGAFMSGDILASNVTAAVTINVDADNPAFLSEGNVIYNKQKTKLIFCSALNSGSFEISQTVTEIGPEAFSGCMDLTSIDIPASVTWMGSFAFGACRGLNELYIHNSKPPLLDIIEGFPGNSIFAFMDISKCTLYVPAGSKSLYKAADGWRDFNIVEMSEIIASSEEELLMPLDVRMYNSSLYIVNSDKPAMVALFDIQGRLVYKYALAGHESIATPRLKTGIYIVKAMSEKGSYSKKVVVN